MDRLGTLKDNLHEGGSQNLHVLVKGDVPSITYNVANANPPGGNQIRMVILVPTGSQLNRN